MFGRVFEKLFSEKSCATHSKRLISPPNPGRFTQWRKRLVSAAMLAVGLAAAGTSTAYAVSPGCAYINNGGLNYNGSFLLLTLGTVVGAFEPGDQIFLDYTRNPARSGVIVSLVALGGVTLATSITDNNGKASMSALIGQLLPINVTTAIVDLNLLPIPTINLKVTCTPAPVATTVALSSAANPSVVGQSASFTATVAASSGGANTPTGAVTFTVDGVNQPSVTLSNGVATYTVANLGLGNHVIGASYLGAGEFLPSSTSLSGGQVVAQASTATSITASAATVNFGGNVTFTATTAAVAPGAGTPTGTVTFLVDNVSVGTASLTGGTASLTVPALAAGTNRVVKASYGGDANFKASEVLLSGGVTVNKVASTLALTQDSLSTVYGKPVVFQASVTGAGGTPTGAVTFTIDNVARTPVTLVGGTAALTISDLPVGSHSVSASYSGGPNHLASSGTIAAGHQVTSIQTTLSMSVPNGVSFGQSATVTATLVPDSGSPTGTVAFTVDGTVLPAVTLSGNSANLMLPGLAAGPHTVSAAYNAVAPFANSSAAPQTLTIAKAASTVTLTQGGPYQFGQSATITAEVSAPGGTPTGQVTFSIDGTPSAPVTLVAGKASLTLPNLSAASHAIIATYAETANVLGSVATGSLLVGKATPVLAVESSANPSVFGQPVSYTARVTSTAGTPSGDVEFTVDGVVLPRVTLSAGVATIASPAFGIKTAVVRAHYLGDGSFLDLTGTLAAGQTIDKAATSLAVTSSAATSAYGVATTFTANLAPVAPGQGTPTGNVVFSIDGVAQSASALNGSGVATLVRSNLGAGPHVITAAYAGDTSFRSSTATLTGGVTVAAAVTTTTVAIAPTILSHGDSATITATVAAATGGPATGSVTISYGGADYPVGLVNGVGTLVLPAQVLGSYSLSASYAATTNFAASASAPTSVVVGKAVASVAVTATPTTFKLGETVALSAKVTAGLGTPSGTVEFFANGTSLGSGTLVNGVGTLSSANVPRGVAVAITATYAGDTTYLGATGTLAGGLTVTAGVATMSIVAAPNPATYGQDVAVTASLTGPGVPVAGVVTFIVNGVSTPVTISGGTAALTLSKPLPGSYPITANYAGSADHLAVGATLAGGLVVGKATSSLDLSTGVGGGVFGQPLEVTALVTSNADVPSGKVTFTVDGVARPDVTLINGKAVLTLTALPAGSHAIAASYGGDALHLGAVGALAANFVVQPVTPTLMVTASPVPAVFGEPVTIVMTGTSSAGAPVGNVVFYLDDVAQAPVALQGGTAQIVTSGLSVGSHAVRAEFAAQGSFSAATGTVAGGITIGVAATTTTLTGTANAMVGDTVTFRAEVKSGTLVPNGTVQFTVDGVVSTPVALVNGVAEFSKLLTQAGSHGVSVTYSGSDSFAPSSATLSGGQLVSSAASTTQLALVQTAEYGAPVATSVTIVVSSSVGTPTGSVTVRVDGNSVGTTSLVNGVGVITLPTLNVGSHTITATYAGELNVSPSVADGKTLMITRAATTVTATVTKSPIYVGQTSALNITVRSAYGAADGAVSFQVGTTNYTGTLVNGAVTVPVNGLVAGVFPITVDYATQPNFQTNSATASLTVQATPAVIVISADLPRGITGQAYTGNATAVGGVTPYAFSATLPSGLSINSTTGAISGTVTTAGTYPVTVTVSDASGIPASTVTTPFSVNFIAPATIALTTPLATITHGDSYASAVTASGGRAPYSYTVSAGALPPGFTLDASTGAIAGLANQSGNYSFSITGTDADGFFKTSPFAIAVNDPVIVVGSVPTTAQVGVPYTATLTASGSIGTYVFSLGGAIPPGLSLNGNILSGTPTTAGSFDFTISAKDQFGFFKALPVTLVVAAADIVVTPEALPPARQNQSYEQVLTATGGTGAITLSTSGTLPTGLTLNAATNTLEGTPTQFGTFSFSVIATDAANKTGSRLYALTVNKAATLLIDATLADAVAWEQYSQTIGVSAGATPYVFTRIGGSLPAGLTLQSDGTLSGKAEATGTFHFTVEVRDRNGDSATASLTLQVKAPTITVTATIPSINFRQALGGTVSVTGGIGPYTFRNAGAPLVGALTIAADGTVSGTPTAAGDFSIVIEATDSHGFIGTVPVLVRVIAPTIVVSGTLPGAILGQQYSGQVTATGGFGAYAYTISDGALPAGLSLDRFSGQITGQGTAVATANFVVTATDADGFAGSKSYTLEIGSNIGNAVLPATIPSTLTRAPYSVALAAMGGVSPLTYSLSGSTLPVGFAIGAQTGLLSGQPLVAGSYGFTVTATDPAGRTNSASYTLSVVDPAIAVVPLNAAVAGTAFDQTVTATGPTSPFTFAVTTSNLPLGLTFDPASGRLEGTPTQAGTFGLTLDVTDKNGFVTSLTYPLTVAAPTMALSYALPAGRVALAYSATPTISGGVSPYAYTATGLPNGLTINATTGEISGTPTAAASSRITVTARDRNDFTVSVTQDLVIASNLGTAVFPTSIPGGTVGTVYTGNFTATGGGAGLTYSVSPGLPAGLTFSPSTGVITGTPTAAGTSVFTVTVTDGAGLVNSQTFELSIAPRPIVLPTLLSAGEVGVLYSQQITPTGGNGVFSYALADAPDGIAISATGLISGTPTTAGTYNVVLTVTDTAGARASQAIALTIAPATVVLVLQGSLPNGTRDVPYSVQLTAGSATGAVTYQAIGTLPPTLTLTPAGLLSGTPTQDGSYTFTIKATDAEGHTGSQVYTLQIAAPPPLAISTTTIAFPTNAVVDQSVSVEATVNAVGGVIPTGTVELRGAGNALLGSAALDGAGKARFAMAFDSAGNKSLTAKYLGSATVMASDSSAGSITIGAALNAIDVSFAANPVQPGEAMTLLAVVTRTGLPATPSGGGTLQLSIDGTPVATETLVNSWASFTRTLTPGTHALVVTYVPSTGNDTGTSVSRTLTVRGTSAVSLHVPTASVVAGGSAQYVATVTGVPQGVTPTGQVSFYDGATLVGTANLSGSTATLNVAVTTLGTHSITAQYAGDTIYTSGASAAASFTVSPPVALKALTTTFVTSQPPSVQVGQLTTLTATVSSLTVTPTGYVSFENAVGTVLARVQLDGTGKATANLTFTSAGVNLITARYEGDAFALPSFGVVTVIPTVAITTTTLTRADATPVVPGDSVTLTASVTRLGGSAPAGGAVAFFANGVEFTRQAIVAGAPVSVSSPAVSVLTSFTAAFVPGGANADAASSSLPVLVTPVQALPSVGLVVTAAANGDVTVTTTVTAPAGVAHVPSGTVTLTGTLGTVLGAASLTNGQAVFTLPQGTLAGQVTLTASYGGDTAFAPAIGVQLYNVALLGTTVLAVEDLAGVPPAKVKVNITVVKDLFGPVPTGDIVATLGGVSQTVTLVNGTATVTLDRLTNLGLLTVSYGGDAAYNSASVTIPVAAAPIIQLPSTTSLSASTTTTYVGQIIALEARVATAALPIATGSVQFVGTGGTVLATVPLDLTGVARASVAFPAGTLSIAANYLGSALVVPSSATQAFTTTQLMATGSISVNPAADPANGHVVTVMLTPPTGVTTLPTGQVIVTSSTSGTTYPAQLVNGVATVTLPVGALTGTVTLTADYGGDAVFVPSQVTQSYNGTLLAATVIAVVAAELPNGQVRVTVNVTPPANGPAVSGTVSLTLPGMAPIVVSVGSGSVDVVLTRPAQAATLVVSYSGDTNYAPSGTTLTLQPRQPVATTTLVSASTTTPYPGQSVTLTAQVSGADGVPNGVVRFVAGNQEIGTVPLNGAGVASMSYATNGAGSLAITAFYDGNANWLASSNAVTLNSVQLTGTTTVSVNGNADGSLTVTVTVTQPAGVTQQPTGSVTLTNAGAPQTGTLNGGTVSFTVPANTIVGPVTINASYSGDATYQPGSGSLPYDGSKAAAVLSASVRDYQPVTSVNVTASVAAVGNLPAPTGTISFAVSGQPTVVEPLSGGTALGQLVRPLVPAVVTVSYSGDANYAPGSVTVSVQPLITATIPTQTVLAASATTIPSGQDVTLTATVSAIAPVAGGSVQFYSNGQPIGTTPLSGGVAQLVVPGTIAGTRTFTAGYLGDPTFLASTSNPVQVSFAGNGTTAGHLTLSLSSDRQALFGVGQVIGLTLVVGAVDADANALVVSSDQFAITCLSGSLVAGASMVCTASYSVTASDMARGSVVLSAVARATGMAAVDSSVQLQSKVDLVSDTFKSLTEDYVVTRARVLGASINLPNIFDRRRGPGGTRAGTVRANAEGETQVLAFTSSLAEWRNWAAAQATEGLALGLEDEPLPVNVWIDAQMTIHARIEDGGKWGSVATVAAGVDYMVTDDFLAGVMVQGDWSKEQGDLSLLSGGGYLVGPYVSIALTDTVSFDAVVLYGGASDTAQATILGEDFTGNFDSTRLYAKAALSGHFDMGAMTVRPNMTFFVGSERADGYTVSNGRGDVVSVAGTDFLQYRVTVGGRLEYVMQLEDGATLTPLAGLDLGLSGTNIADGDATQALIGTLTLGLDYQTINGFRLGAKIAAEGGSDGFTSARASATISGSF